MIGIIACCSKNGVLGIDGKLALPNYPDDMKHFRKTTADSTIIMGRKTFEEIGKPLPKRQNLVVSSSDLKVDGIEIVKSIKDALSKATKDNIWFCGGASIYEGGMEHASTIVLTICPDVLRGRSNTYAYFPWINPTVFTLKTLDALGDGGLLVATYSRV